MSAVVMGGEVSLQLLPGGGATAEQGPKATRATNRGWKVDRRAAAVVPLHVLMSCIDVAKVRTLLEARLQASGVGCCNTRRLETGERALDERGRYSGGRIKRDGAELRARRESDATEADG
jgi:hypothetical protein